MKTYSTTITKREFVKELKKHQKADAFVKGTYGKKGLKEFRGCAVGCSLRSISTLKKIEMSSYDNHEDYEKHLGIPEWLARLEDTIFEGVGDERVKTWPVEFAEAIPTGVDLDQVKTPFLIKVLERSILSMDSVVYDKTKFPQVEKAILQSKEAVRMMIRAYKGEENLDSAYSAARSAAYSAYSAYSADSADSAAYSASSAADSAASSAADSAASSAASSAAYSAASSAYSAASSAYSAADSAADSAYSAARSAADSAAYSAAFEYFADELISLLKEAK